MRDRNAGPEGTRVWKFCPRALADTRGCFFPVPPRAVANFGMSACDLFSGAFQPPPAPLQEKRSPSESCWPVGFRMDARYLCASVCSRLPPLPPLRLTHVIANNVCMLARFSARWP